MPGPVRLGVVAGLALAICARAHADPPAPCPLTVDAICTAGVADLVTARGLALGAYRGVAGGNDAMFTNAASLAARRRYSIEAGWMMERVSSDTALQAFGASVVDSETTSVTGGFAYTRVVSGPWIGNVIYVPLAFPLTPNFFFGLTGKYQSLDGPDGDSMRAANVDVSGFYRAGGGFGIGVAGYNLLDSGHVSQLPRGLGVGVSYGDDRRYNLAADWRADFQRRGQTTSLFAIGGEVLVGDAVPLRASFVHDETRSASYWSAGLGVVSASGLAVDLAYRQSFDHTDDRTFAATLKLFLSSR